MKAQDSPAQRAPGARTLDRAFRALGFPDKRRARFAPTGLPEISAEAMRLVHPRALTKRDANLLASVEHLAVALDSQTVDMTAFRDLAYLYLAVICCGWASDEDLSPGARNAALIGAIGFAGSANAAARVALGVEDQLIALLPASSLDAAVRSLIATVVSGLDASALLRALEPALERARRPTTGRKRRPRAS